MARTTVAVRASARRTLLVATGTARGSRGSLPDISARQSDRQRSPLWGGQSRQHVVDHGAEKIGESGEGHARLRLGGRAVSTRNEAALARSTDSCQTVVLAIPA